jgi:hypothetical protein
MLDDARQRRRAELRRLRDRLHRARLREGLACYTIAINGTVFDMMVRLGWIDERHLTDKTTVAAAIATMLVASAENLNGAAHGRCPNCGLNGDRFRVGTKMPPNLDRCLNAVTVAIEPGEDVGAGDAVLKTADIIIRFLASARSCFAALNSDLSLAQSRGDGIIERDRLFGRIELQPFDRDLALAYSIAGPTTRL